MLVEYALRRLPQHPQLVNLKNVDLVTLTHLIHTQVLPMNKLETIRSLGYIHELAQAIITPSILHNSHLLIKLQYPIESTEQFVGNDNTGQLCTRTIYRLRQ